MRPALVEFREDGSVSIDESVYGMKEMLELTRMFGRQYVEVIARLHSYRSPINPYAPEEERNKRAFADTKFKNAGANLQFGVLDHKLFKEAVKRFLTERHDPLWSAYAAYEHKIEEMVEAISTTPVLQEIGKKEKPKTSRYGKKKKAYVTDFGDEDERDDEEDADAEPKRYQDNSEQLFKMDKTLVKFKESYEDLRVIVLRVKAGNSSLPQRAKDMIKAKKPV